MRLTPIQNSSIGRKGKGKQALISLEMKTFELSKMPDYTALSYSWTQQEPDHEIHLSGRSFHIRSNLFDYLQMLHREHIQKARRRKSIRSSADWIFIDALCINQDDIKERGHQVKRMGAIYGNATEVVAWLGTSLGYRRRKTSRVRKFGRRSRDWNEIQKILSDSSVLSRIWSGSRATILGRHLDTLAAMFLEHSYWSRMWIVQEIALASVLTFQFRDFRLGDSSFNRLITHIKRQDFTPRYSSWVPSQIMLLRGQLSTRSNQNQDKGSMVSAIIDYSEQECTEPYDRVFGVLGLADTTLIPDYNMPRLELFQRVFTESMLRFDKATNLIDETESRWDRPEPYGSRKALFCQKLLSALELDGFDLLTATLIYFTLYGLTEFQRSRNGRIADLVLEIGAPATTRMATTLETVEHYLRKPDDVITPLGNTGSISLREWIREINPILVEVVTGTGICTSIELEKKFKSTGDRFLGLKKLP